MKPPLFLRPLTDDARLQLEAERRTADACRVRRAPIGRASARRRLPKPLAPLVGGAVPTVRHILQAFHEPGGEGVARPSNRPKTVTPVLDAGPCERLQPILPPAPRLSGKPTGVWTRAWAADVCDAQGVTERLGRAATMRRARQRLATPWKRAKPGSTSPAPPYVRKKSGAIA